MLTKQCRRFFLVFVALGFCLGAQADAVWIDVRSSAEHMIDRIDGDVRISYDEIVAKADALFPDKSTEIRLYCRSGGRAGKAMTALQEAGYTHVFNMGGIDDARSARGLTEQPL